MPSRHQRDPGDRQLCGKPVATARGQATACALIDTRRYTIAPPGRLPLFSDPVLIVDVPDRYVLPELWPSCAWSDGRGPVPEVWHRALNALAWLVRWKLLPSLSPFAPLMYRAINLLSWGSIAAACSSQCKERAPWRTDRRLGTSCGRGGWSADPLDAAAAIIRHCSPVERPRRGRAAATTSSSRL